MDSELSRLLNEYAKAVRAYEYRGHELAYEPMMAARAAIEAHVDFSPPSETRPNQQVFPTKPSDRGRR